MGSTGKDLRSIMAIICYGTGLFRNQLLEGTSWNMALTIAANVFLKHSRSRDRFVDRMVHYRKSNSVQQSVRWWSSSSDEEVTKPRESESKSAIKASQHSRLLPRTIMQFRKTNTTEHSTLAHAERKRAVLAHLHAEDGLWSSPDYCRR